MQSHHNGATAATCPRTEARATRFAACVGRVSGAQRRRSIKASATASPCAAADGRGGCRRGQGRPPGRLRFGGCGRLLGDVQLRSHRLQLAPELLLLGIRAGRGTKTPCERAHATHTHAWRAMHASTRPLSPRYPTHAFCVSTSCFTTTSRARLASLSSLRAVSRSAFICACRSWSVVGTRTCRRRPDACGSGATRAEAAHDI